MSEVLVTALAVALTRWSGAGSVTIDLEGHGRDEDIVRGDGDAHVDLTRTVGWFTTVFPVALEIGTAAPDLDASGELAGVLKRRQGATSTGPERRLRVRSIAIPRLLGSVA